MFMIFRMFMILSNYHVHIIFLIAVSASLTSRHVNVAKAAIG
jgi:hypothetical protein